MTQIDLTPKRIAENQATFREANERIEAVAHNTALAGEVPFICECPDPDCMAIVRLDLDAYEDLRQHPRRFFAAPGHAAPSLEAGASVVVEKCRGYTVVDKVGAAGEIAEDRYDDLLS